MANQMDLQRALETILGNRHVYFQPPQNVRLTYPCIIYKRRNGDYSYADNRMYKYTDSYELIVIDPNPNSELPYRLMNEFSYIREERRFVSDQLYHTVFILYY